MTLLHTRSLLDWFPAESTSGTASFLPSSTSSGEGAIIPLLRPTLVLTVKSNLLAVNGLRSFMGQRALFQKLPEHFRGIVSYRNESRISHVANWANSPKYLLKAQHETCLLPYRKSTVLNCLSFFRIDLVVSSEAKLDLTLHGQHGG